MKIRTIVGVAIIAIALSGITPNTVIDWVTPKPVVVNVIPENYVDLTKPISDLVGEEDKLRVAVFSHEFSKRLTSEAYNDIKLQNLNNVLVLAGKEYYDPPIVGKYPGLSEGITGLIKGSAGDDDVYLSTEVLNDLAAKFEALAWNLTQ